MQTEKRKRNIRWGVLALALSLLLPTVSGLTSCDFVEDDIYGSETVSQQVNQESDEATSQGVTAGVGVEAPTEEPIAPTETEEDTTEDPWLPMECEHEFACLEYGNDFRILCTKCGVDKSVYDDCQHKWVEFVLSSGGIYKYCIYCGSGELIEIQCNEDHSFVIEVEPTYYHSGIESAHCDNCGYSEVRILSPLNEGSYTCTLTLQEYADGAASALFELAELTYKDNVASGVVEINNFPFGDLATYREIREFTQKLAEGETTQYGKVKKIYDWVVENIIYDSEASYYDIGKVWETKRAVCSQYVQLMHDMLSAIDVMSAYTGGFSTYVPWDQRTDVTVPTVFQHVFDTGHSVVTCYVDGRVLVMDPTWGVSNPDKYFDMSAEELASYFIPLEMNMIKVIPENVDDRNYIGCMRRIGDHITYLAYGELTDNGGIQQGVNNLSFDYGLLLMDFSQNVMSDRIQYIGTAVRSGIVDKSYYYLPDGRRITFSSMAEYILLLNENYEKNISLPLLDHYEMYDGCLYFKISVGYQLVSCSTKAEEITIKGSINGIPVVSIGDYVFYYNQHIKKVIVEEGVCSIGHLAFAKSTLEEIYLPSTFESISASFLHTSIRIFEIAEENPYYKTVDNVWFSKDGRFLIYYAPEKQDTEYYVPEGTVKVFEIQNNPYLKRLILPESVVHVGNLTSLYELEYLNLPDSIVFLGQIMGTKLTEIVVPDSVRDVYGSAFTSNYLLTRLVLPRSLEYLAFDATWGCESLVSIEISDENEYFCSVDGVIYSKDMKNLIIYPLNKADKIFKIPEGVEKVSDFLFVGCQNLREVKLPSTLTTLSMAMFNTSSVEKVNLNYVEKLGSGTFSGCKNIKVLVLPENIKEIGSQEFYNCFIEALVIENPNLITEQETFMQAETLTIYLNYDGITDKERGWMPYVAGVYERSSWEYVNGVPTLIGEVAT